MDDDLINFGNPDLEPEKTWSYSLSYERRFADDGGSVELKASYEDSETTDPFTGEKRRLRFSTPDYFQVNFRHDVEGTNFAYGFNAHRRSGRIRQDISLYEDTDFEIHLGSAFVEYNFTPNLRVRFAGAHFLNDDGRVFDKIFYEGNIADGVIRRIDVQDWRIDPDYVLSLQATF